MSRDNIRVYENETDIQAATESAVNTGTNDTDFVTSKALRDSGYFSTAAGEFTGITAKAVPVDGDISVYEDSEAAGAKKIRTWANIKAALKTYFDGLYQGIAQVVLTAESAPADPAAGTAVIWMDAGGDVSMKITVGATTKTVLLADFSEIA